jgi:hypothetical protein
LYVSVSIVPAGSGASASSAADSPAMKNVLHSGSEATLVGLLVSLSTLLSSPVTW